MNAMAFQITSLTIVYSAVYSGTDQRKHQSPASLAFVRGIHRRFPAQRASNAFPLHDVIMNKFRMQWAERNVAATLKNVKKKDKYFT